ncbi:MAG: hypothetical protein H7145_03020 [Akkermansiaceae bacterium]|nr:hypothetical protein [Armatimonadota bacterium]
MASSLRTKLRITYNVLFAPGFWDAVAGRFAWVSHVVPPSHPEDIRGKGTGGTEGFQDLRGALHNHSTYSDGLSDIPTIMDAAEEAGVDFVLLADHNTMQALHDGWQERYADASPFLMVGTEVTVEGGRFLLALDVSPEYEPVIGVSAQAGIDTIRTHRGFPLISLPFDMKHPYEDWSVSGYDGLEVLNFSTIARRHINFLSLPWILIVRHFGGMMAVIRMMATRPDAALARWDLLTRGGARRVVGIGSLDAHARMKMFGKMYSIPTYADSFRACQTHVLVPDGVSGAERIPAVNAALRAGRCYFSYDCLGDPTKFDFVATNKVKGAATVMGECLSISMGETVCFTATSPGESTLLRLYRDGQPVASSVGRTLSVTLPATPGAYRIEVSRFQGRLGGLFWGVRPWIYSNPIYLS